MRRSDNLAQLTNMFRLMNECLNIYVFENILINQPCDNHGDKACQSLVRSLSIPPRFQSISRLPVKPYKEKTFHLT